MLMKIILKCFSLRVILDLLNQVVSVNTMWSFHHRIWHTEDVEVDVFVINRKVEFVRVNTMFERTNFLHFVRASFHRFPRSIVISHDAFFFIFHRFIRSIWRTKFSLRLTNNLLGHRFPRSIFNGLKTWVGLEKTAWSVSPSDCWTSFPTGWCSIVESDWSFLLSNWDRFVKRSLVVGKNKYCLSYNFSSFQSFNFYNTMGWEYTLICSLILDHDILLKIFHFWSQNSYFVCPARFFSSPFFQSVTIRSSLLMSLQNIQFQHGLEFLRLSYS